MNNNEKDNIRIDDFHNLDMSELEKETVHKIIHLMHKHRRMMEIELESTGVFQSQHRLLMEISKNPQRSQKELAEKMKVSTAAVAVSLKKLEKGGYIIRETDAEDTRLNQVVITKKGEDVVRKSMEIFKKTDARLFEGFSKEEIIELAEILDRLTENLRK